MDQEYKKLLIKQGYRFVGEHSACKICHYTKSSIRGKIECYKQKFYGIKSHQCAQVSVAVNFCNLDCVFCWRDRNNSEFGMIDDPKDLVGNFEKAQISLLEGFGGNPNINENKYLESKNIQHFAISLNGESLVYPKISELINEIKNQRKTSFVVTNGMMPHIMEKMALPTQLYLSLSASNKNQFLKIDRPLCNDGWKKLLKSMKILKSMKEKTRTVLRITLIKNMNMEAPKEFAKLVEIADPTYLEVKGFSWIGASRNRLDKINMPEHSEVKDFSEEISKHCSYKIIDEHEESRVVLLMEEDREDRIMNF